MKLLQFSLLLIFTLLMGPTVSEAAVLHPKPVDKTEVATGQQMSKKEQRQLRKEQRRSFRKAVREQVRALRQSSSSSDIDLILLVIIALFIPPLAMFLYDGEASSRFWISLVLMLLAIPLWGSLGALAFLASIIYTLYIILSESL